MKRVVIVVLLVLIAILIYRFIFCYRVIALANEGNLKYKEGRITYFARPPLSVINPLKQGKILNKINLYCLSKEFSKYFVLNYSDQTTLIDTVLLKKLAGEKLFRISAIKEKDDRLLILATNKKNQDFEIVFIFNPLQNNIEGYY
ncbi:MAG TPA: hypothetical protein P5531_13770 [Bacteroidales bacterium]|nr:hypothetical protein [Bacteroidales bacterium]HSA44660.1 hypothetical protein [Bacteroidales bacterium]